MATVIEPGIVGSEPVRRVAYLTGLDEDAVLGKLVRLWEASQQLEKEKAKADEIAFWLRATSTQQAEQWIAALADSLAGFLVPQPDGMYLIRGNQKHIDKIRGLKEHARENAKKRWQKNPKPAPVDAPKDASSIAASIQHVVLPASSTSCLDQARPSQAKPSIEIQAPPTNPTKSIDPYQIRQGIEEWGRTLKKHGNEKDPKLDELQIGQLIQIHGFQKTILALRGAADEEGSPTYNPAKHVSIRRLFKPTVFDTFVNLGAMAKAADAERERRRQESAQTRAIHAAPYDPQEPHVDPEKVRALIAGRFGQGVA